MNKPYAFVFWHSSKTTPAYISLCFETQSLNLSDEFEVIQLNFDNCIEWIPERDELFEMCTPSAEGRSDSIEGRTWAIFSDLLRIFLIRRYGGIWIDADTIIFPQFSVLSELIPEYSFISSESEGMRIANGVMGGCANSVFFEKLTDKLIVALDQKKKLGDTSARWGEYGFSILKEILSTWEQDNLLILPLGMTIPFETSTSDYIFSSSEVFEKYIPITALAVSFFNNSTKYDHRVKSAEQLISSNTVFSKAYKYATENENDYFVIKKSSQLVPLNRLNLVREVARTYKKKNSNMETLKQKLKERNRKIVELKDAARKIAVADDSEPNEDLHRKNVFQVIFREGLWEQGGSKSGCGSSLRQTESLRESLPGLLQRIGTRSLIDIPCGDFNWMQHINLSGIQYIGGDIVPEIIKQNNTLFSNEFRSFKLLDIVKDEIPTADCILVRDCYSHLPNSEVLESLKKIALGKSKFLLVTNYKENGKNMDIRVGEFRCIDFEKHPFNLPPPRESLNEGHPNPKFSDKSLALWHREDLLNLLTDN